MTMNPMKNLLAAALGAWMICAAPAAGASSQKPRLAIFMSRASYAQNRAASESAGRGWAGLANLAGFPYDTLFLEEAGDLAPYRVVVFAQCAALSGKTYGETARALEKYLAAGGSVIVEGPLGRLDET